MPNHVTTIMEIDTLEEAYDFATKEVLPFIAGKDEDGKEMLIDFEKIVPPPADMFRGNLSAEDEKNHPCNWYSWCPENWGTKWNAYAISTNGYGAIRFDTAWRHPEPVLVALSKRFPSIEIKVMYADEDIGCNLGAYKLRGGKKYDEYSPKKCSLAANYFAEAIKFKSKQEKE